MIKRFLREILFKAFVRPDSLLRVQRQLKYAKDGLYTIHNCKFIEDEQFRRAYQAGKNTGSWGKYDVEWRVHTALWAARKAYELEGDFVECGVNKGGLSMAIIEYLAFEKSTKKFYLLDTFEGFDRSVLLDSEKKKYNDASHYEKTYDEVRKTFGRFSNIEIVRGTVPFTLPEVKSSRVAYLSIDMNCVQPELAALDFFWPKMTSGGVILLDDFAYAGFEEQNIAHTMWAKKNNISILSVPTGQGLIIKP